MSDSIVQEGWYRLHDKATRPCVIVAISWHLRFVTKMYESASWSGAKHEHPSGRKPRAHRGRWHITPIDSRQRR